MRKYTVSRNDDIYQAWPDVTLTASGELVCVFSQCTHHGDRGFTRIICCRSDDRGRNWTDFTVICSSTRELGCYYNCARISVLKDGRLAIVVDKVYSFDAEEKRTRPELLTNVMFFSDDGGKSWSDEVPTSIRGIVPDKLIELDSGRWLVGVHHNDSSIGKLVQFLYYSDDKGLNWKKSVVGRSEELNLCELSVVPVEADTLVGLMRENSFTGMDCYKAISHDGGCSWGDLVRFPLPACHRPVGGRLNDGRYLITYRFMQGGKGWLGSWTQNFFGAFTDRDSLLAQSRSDATVRIFPIDYDRSPQSDLGYSGWVQFPDEEIYVVNYIVDDAPKSQIRGYAFKPEEFLIDSNADFQ